MAIYAALFPAERVGVLRAERVFDASSRPAALASVAAFLGYPAPAGAAPGQSCWHDCGQKKRAFGSDVPAALASTLEELYAPSERALEALVSRGRVTAL